MEIDLAERILVRYKEMKSLLSKIRNSYLLRKNKQQRKNLQEEKVKSLHKEKIKSEAEAIGRMKKTFKMILKLKEQKKEGNYKNNFSANRSELNRSLNQENIFSSQKSNLNQIVNQKFTDLLDQNNPKVRKHKYHPSSKLLRNSQNLIQGEEKPLWG